MGASANVGQPEMLLKFPGGWVKPHRSGLWESPPASWRQPLATSGMVASFGSTFPKQTAPSIPRRPSPSDEGPGLGVSSRKCGPTLGCRRWTFSPRSAADLLFCLWKMPPPRRTPAIPPIKGGCQARKTIQWYHLLSTYYVPGATSGALWELLKYSQQPLRKRLGRSVSYRRKDRGSER